MIELVDVSHTFRVEGKKQRVLDQISFQLRPGERLGVLGTPKSGKSTLIRLVNGATYPTRGKVSRSMSVSWPWGLAPAVLSPKLTGYENLRFIAKLYQTPYDELCAYVKDFAQFDRQLSQLVSNYSGKIRAQLAFAISMAIDFDCYLVDGNLLAGTKDFRDKCKEALIGKFEGKALLLATDQPDSISEYCEEVLLLDQGKVVDRFNLNQSPEWLARWHQLAGTEPGRKRRQERAQPEEDEDPEDPDDS